MKLSLNENLTLATSTKNDGNMSLFRGNQKNVAKNREKFLAKLGLNISDIVVLKLQHEAGVHLATIKDLGKGSISKSSVIASDALITNEKGVYLFLLTADCLPITVFDPINQAIGLIHVSKFNIDVVIDKAIKKMAQVFRTHPKNLIIKIGPSIGPCHYSIDLWEKAQNNIENLGVIQKNIDNEMICTYTNNYYSHREFIEKNLKEDNRIATVFGMKS